MNPESFGRLILFFFFFFFIRWRNKIEPSSLPRILYSRWPTSFPGSLSYPSLRRMLCCQYSLGTGINPNTCRIRWKGKLDLNTDTRGRGNFWIRKEDVSVSKLSEYVWTGPEQIITSLFEWIQLVNCDCPFVRKSGTSAKCWSFLSFSLKWFITKGSRHLQTDGKLYSGS